jgi:hypothetical protein
MSALDALNELSAAVKPKKKATSERPVVECPTSVHSSFARFTAAKSIFDVAESRVQVEKDIVCNVMLEAYMATMFNTGAQPLNPTISLEKGGRVDSTGIFQVKQQYKFNLEEGAGKVKDRMIAALKEAGYNRVEKLEVDGKIVLKCMAAALVEAEIDTTPRTGLRPFNELSIGHYVDKQFVPATDEEKLIAEKLIGFVMGRKVEPLTEREREIVVVKEDRIKVKDGFLARVRLYCISLEEVKAIFRIIVPTNYLSHVQWAIQDTPEQKIDRMVKEFTSLVGEK